jgi:hypothetical protein
LIIFLLQDWVSFFFFFHLSVHFSRSLQTKQKRFQDEDGLPKVLSTNYIKLRKVRSFLFTLPFLSFCFHFFCFFCPLPLFAFQQFHTRTVFCCHVCAQEYRSKWTQLLQWTLEDEQAETEKRLKEWSKEKLQKEGLALFSLQVVSHLVCVLVDFCLFGSPELFTQQASTCGNLFGDLIIKLVSSEQELLPFNRFGNNDMVCSIFLFFFFFFRFSCLLRRSVCFRSCSLRMEWTH